MAELSHAERLSPSLLDRLTDRAPDSRVEPLEKRFLTETQLREAVLRDLEWLLNTTHYVAGRSLEGFPEASKSVINFGVPDLAGRTRSSVNAEAIEKQLRDAILAFEPRLIKSTLRVRMSQGRDASAGNAISFEIEAQLWCQPLPMRLTLRTDVDLETGTVVVNETTE